MPRGEKLGYPLNQYANWVQAQPAAGKGAALFSAHWVSGSIADRSPPGRPVWVVRSGSWLGTFSLAKSSPSHKTILSCGFSLQKALPTQRLSPAAACDQQALPAGHPPPFEKGGRKLLNIGSWSIKGRVLLRLFAAVKLPVDLRKDVLVHLLCHPVKVLDHLISILPLDVRRVARLDIALV